MKCPKCHYLGFETTDRCRHCGYDFSLASARPASTELPLHAPSEAEAPLSDLDLGERRSTPRGVDAPGALDLDRLIGESTEAEDTASIRAYAPRAGDRFRTNTVGSAVATPPPAELQAEYQPTAADSDPPMPLLTESTAPIDDIPLVPAPRPARPPLGVRRATPDIQRRRTPRPLQRHDEEEPSLQLEPSTVPSSIASEPSSVAAPLAPASRFSRLGSAVIDVALVGSIDAVVLYLTLAIAGLAWHEWRILPPIPMAAFLVLLNAGYLIAFTVAGGQTIGKMMFGTRVVGDDGQPVDPTGAMLRALGSALSVLTIGIGHLPAVVSPGGRALQDRLAGTRVVKN